MLAAFVSLAVMGVVIVKVGLRDEPAAPPPKPGDNQAHTKAAHHTEDKHEGGMPAPLQVFANANLGDWQVIRVTTATSLAPTITSLTIVRTVAVDDTQVKREFVGRIEEDGGNDIPQGEARKDWSEQRPRAGLTLDQL